MLLKNLCACPLESRAAWIICNHEKDLEEALSLATSQGLPEGLVNASEIAWAMAYNLDPPSEPTKNTLQRYRHYRLEHNFDKLWGEFLSNRPLANILKRHDGLTRTTGLCELAWSIACEAKEAWLCPCSVQRLQQDRDNAFKKIVERDHWEISFSLGTRYAEVAEKVEDTIHLKWAQLKTTHWSTESENRFLGLTTIRRFVAKWAEQELWKICPEPMLGIDPNLFPVKLRTTQQVMDPLDDVKYPSPGSIGQYFDQFGEKQALDGCLDQLGQRSPMSSIYAVCYHVFGLRVGEIATRFSVAPPDISRQLKDIWAKMQADDCLRAASNRIMQRYLQEVTSERTLEDASERTGDS